MFNILNNMHTGSIAINYNTAIDIIFNFTFIILLRFYFCYAFLLVAFQSDLTFNDLGQMLLRQVLGENICRFLNLCYFVMSFMQGRHN